MDNMFTGISCAFYTVKQLSALFNKSEDTIRRWKNEGIGKEEDNIKLRAIEREDGSGRKNVRHLVFSREAVIDFVKANPFLMDDAPQLNMMMQAENAWRDGGIPMPGTVGGFVPPSEDEWNEDDWEEEKNQDTGFMAAVRRLTNRFEKPEQDEDEDADYAGTAFVRDRVPLYPSFERSAASQSRRPSFVSHGKPRVSPIGDEDEEPFSQWEPRAETIREGNADYGSSRRRDPGREYWDSQPFSSNFDDLDNKGWKNRIPRSGPGRRQAADEEFIRRGRVINFALDTLRNDCKEMERRREKMGKEIEEVQSSSMDAGTINSIIDVMEQKISELGQHIDMLEEFIAVIEEEMAES